MDKHYCGVTDYTKGRGKICTHITIKCASYESNYLANLLYYISKYKADVKICQQKKTREKKGQKSVDK